MKVLIVGAGFYGLSLALYHHSIGDEVEVVDESAEAMGRASYVNQARVHNGYHYPRSVITALRSRVNFPRFVEKYSDCCVSSFTKIYAIARQNSRVNALQFERFCQTIGAEIDEADSDVASLFVPEMVEKVYRVKEYAFDSHVLRRLMLEQAASCRVPLTFETRVEKLLPCSDGKVEAKLSGGRTEVVDLVVTATYSRINWLLRESGLPEIPMKHEITEVALVEPPRALGGLGVTVMDGPFWSSMPFPPRRLHSLTHVRYTPHESWLESEVKRDPYAYLASYAKTSKALAMKKDAARYLPAMNEAKIVDSLLEVKTVLPQNEGDDGRPILLRSNHGIPGVRVVMGGKIDNIFDVIETIEGDRNEQKH